MSNYLDKLKKLQDKKYAEFQAKLIPTVDKKRILGVRTPDLRKLAKELSNDKDVDKFLDKLPHKYFDENQLHAFIVSEIKDYDICIKRVNKFLPYVDNWATCDQMSPKVFAKNKDKLIKEIKKWIKAYTVRFGIGMLMEHYLDENFDKKYLNLVSSIKFKNYNEYYVEMMRAWYFATALAKQYKDTLPYIKNKKLNEWTHNKTIQKAVESYRITNKQKDELRKYKI